MLAFLRATPLHVLDRRPPPFHPLDGRPRIAEGQPLFVFVDSAQAIIPFAGLLGRATEHLTSHVGLLNASRGNAVELIIALAALREGLHDVVKASLTGSIPGNILLVLGASMIAGGRKHERQDRHDAHDFGQAPWSYRMSVSALTIETVLTAVMSERLVGAIELAAERLGLTQVLIGVILVALVGNVAEHATAVLMAMKNKMDLAFGIAVGPSLQIALLIAPVLVFASYLLGAPLDLIFIPCEVAAVTVSVLILGFVFLDGEWHWMEGVMLVGVYAMRAIAFYFLPA
jgi:Ca2+:H+ antiporter